MARRKAEVALQMAVESQEEWEELLSKEGLNVVDLYQEWCGPCTGMVANLRRLKNELGDDLLRFATAKADTIDSLEKYRGHCEPCFLFYAGGCLVAVVRGANSPKILRTITEQLKQEHKVLDGNSERKEIKDPFIAEKEAREKETDKEEEEEEEGAPGARGRAEGVKEVTVALIKPDAVAAGKVDEILNDIQAHGIQVLEHQERHMTVEEVESFYSHLKEEEYFDDLCKFMTSGPSHILVLTKGKTGENIISEFRDLIGPTDVEEAKTQAPESLRAKHGEKAFMNALHGSSSTQTAAGELAFFFPDFVIPACETAPKLQRTLALVRPEAFKLHKEDILSKIKESGFKVAMQKEMQLTKEMAEDFYKEHQDQPYFEQLVTNMSSGPVLALGLAREDAIQGWRDMLGPKEVDKAKEEAPESLRAQFAVDDAINSLHGSDSEQTAKKELEFFFPMEQTVAVIKPDAAGTKDEIIERIHEAGFRIAARKETTLSREVAEQFYSDHQGKDYYNELVDNMTSGPTYLMVLSREAAVDGWRSLIGPTDPTQAKEEAPESLRATYGENILKNAVHGSSNPAHAQESIKVLFGSNLKFAPDGSLLESIDEAPETEKDGPEAEIPTDESTDKPVSQESKQVEEVAPENRESEEQQEQQQQSEGEQKQEETKPEQTDEEPKTETEMDTAPKSDSQTDGTETQVDVDTQQKEDTEQEASKPEEVPVHEIDKETSGDIDTDKKEENEVEESTQEADTGVEEVPTTEAPAGDIEAEVEEDKQETPTEEKTEEKPASPKPSESEAQQSETEAKPSEEEAKPSETETQQSETEAQPSESEAKPSESEAKPDEQTEEKTEEKKDEEEKKEEEQTEEKPKSPEAQTTQEESKEEEKKEEEKKEGAD